MLTKCPCVICFEALFSTQIFSLFNKTNRMTFFFTTRQSVKTKTVYFVTFKSIFETINKYHS